jgi:hypothetical protein
VPSKHFLSKTEEENQYSFHQNNPDDSGYRTFLSKLYDPMIKLLDTSDCGLDYGSGPGPTLSVMLEERGHTMNIYDYIFAADDSVLENTYDFITCTETIEHFRSPRDDLINIWEMLKQGGYLGVMTKFYSDEINFSKWYYKNDPTHICFYSSTTIEWLAGFWDATIVHQETDVVIFQKRKEQST